MMFMAIAASALQTVSTISQGMQAAEVGSRNAAMLREQASATQAATYDREGLQRQRSAVTLADQRASLLANGVDPSSGMAAFGVAQNTRDAEMDALTLRYNGLMEARNMNIQADQVEWEGKAKKRQAYISAASNLMSSASGYMGQKQAPAPVESRTIPGPRVYK